MRPESLVGPREREHVPPRWQVEAVWTRPGVVVGHRDGLDLDRRPGALGIGDVECHRPGGRDQAEAMEDLGDEQVAGGQERDGRLVVTGHDRFDHGQDLVDRPAGQRVDPLTDECLEGGQRIHDIEPIAERPDAEGQARDRVVARAPDEEPSVAVSAARADHGRDPPHADHQLIVGQAGDRRHQGRDGSLHRRLRRAVIQVGVDGLHRRQEPVQVVRPAVDSNDCRQVR